MTQGERIYATLAGSETDRTPFSLWYHFALSEPSAEALARETLGFYRMYEPDLLKVMHDLPYDLPADLPVLEKPEDWTRLMVHPPDTGAFAEQLRALKMIVRDKNDDTPVVDTIFSIYAAGQQLTGGRLMAQLDADPAPVRAGLAHLAGALAAYAEAVVGEAGCAGIYLAISGATTDTLPAERYAREFLEMDRRILSGAAAGRCNVVHLHGDNLYFDMLAPLIDQAQVVSWSDRAAGPALAEIQARTGKTVMGGVNERTIAGKTPDAVRAEIADAVAQAGRRGLIVAPGCAVPTETAPALLHAFSEGVTRARV